MKKLNEIADSLEKGDVLTREQLRNVMGGNVPPEAPVCHEQVDCTLTDPSGHTDPGVCSAYGSFDTQGMPQVECFCQTEKQTTPTPVTGGRSKCYV